MTSQTPRQARIAAKSAAAAQAAAAQAAKRASRSTGPKLIADPAGLSDDKILRDMPITAKDLGKIKKFYGIK
jgi:hypothetical protein